MDFTRDHCETKPFSDPPESSSEITNSVSSHEESAPSSVDFNGKCTCASVILGHN